jgi:putative hemolysin
MLRTTIEIVLILLLIVANGVFAMAEMALVSAKKVRLKSKADQGDERAKVALALANSPGQFLSTVQVGITLVGVLAGAFGGATIAEKLGTVLMPLPLIGPYGEGIALGVVVSIITALSLVVGELVPKQLALHNPESIAISLASPMEKLSRLVGPAVRFLSRSTDFIVRIFGIRKAGEPPITEEEIKILIAQGTDAGVFEEAEEEMVRSILRLGDRRAGDVMTPWSQLVVIDVEEEPRVNWTRIAESGHSHFPVFEGRVDNVIGLVAVKDLWAQFATGKDVEIRGCLKPAVYVPARKKALDLLEVFRTSGHHVALVADEIGNIEGLVRFNDVLKSVVSPSTLPGEPNENPVVKREDGSWLIDGMLPIDELREVLGRQQLPGEGTGSFQSLGGFVVHQLGKLPQTSDHFVVSGFRFEVVDMDGKRVDKVLVSEVAARPPRDGEN